jgi:hypothetical protein
VRRLLGALISALMLVAAVNTAATSALASPAQAAGQPGPSFGIRLVDVPVSEAGNPRALRYIIDHLHPGVTIRRRILVANLSPNAAHLMVYPDAAIISRGSFIGDAGQARSDLTTWITTSRDRVSLSPRASAMVTVTIHVPRDASSGERYGVIWAQETSQVRYPKGVTITEINRVGVRIYLSVGPGGAPPSNFAITSLTAARTAHGQPVVRAQISNTGGRALDISGYVQLSHGPGGLAAGPYQVDTDITIAPGQSWPVTITLSNQLPAGPWRALINLTSGVTNRQATATIRFPGPAVKAKAASSGYLILAAILLVVLILALVATWLIRRNRRSRRSAATPGQLDLLLSRPQLHADNPRDGKGSPVSPRISTSKRTTRP